MKKIEHIVAYLKTYCGWSMGIRAVMQKYNLKYEEKDIQINPQFRQEMEELSGQQLSPCVSIDGKMLADISGEELEDWLDKEGFIQKNDNPTEFPTNEACQDLS